MSELTSAQFPPASFSPQREDSPVRFAHTDQHPSAITSDLVLFGGSEDDPLDDSMSLAASERKRRGLSLAAAGPPSKQPHLCLQTSRSVPGAGENVFVINTGSFQAPIHLTAVIAD